MNDQNVVLVLNAALWLFFSYRLVRALQRRKINGPAPLQAWLLFVSCYLTAVLVYEPLAAAVDRLFGGIPMAMLLRTVMMLLTAQFYFMALRRLHPLKTSADAIFTVVNPGVMLLCLIIFIISIQSQLLTHDQLDALIKGIRDLAISFWVVTIFAPITWQLWKIEQLRPMKIHRTLSLVFLAVFLVQTLGGLGLSVATLQQTNSASFFETVDRLSKYGCLVLLLALLFPYRWVLPLLYPRKLYTLFRLARLESYMELRTYLNRPLAKVPVNLWQLEEIELAIYQKIIAILDMYRLLDDSGQALHSKIQAVITEEPPFERLVWRLAVITP